MQFHGLFIPPIFFTIAHLITGALPYPGICDKENIQACVTAAEKATAFINLIPVNEELTSENHRTE